MRELRQLWRSAFGDTEQYIEYYFSEKAPGSRIVEDWEGQKLCSMAFFCPYDAYLYEKKIKLSYIVGVATEAAYRHQGRMRRILEQGMKREKEYNRPLVFLSPVDPAIYEPFGFQSVYWRDTLLLHDRKAPLHRVRVPMQSSPGARFSPVSKVLRWSELSEREKIQVSRFAEEILQSEKFDLRLEHGVAYYEQVDKEMKVLGGSVLTFWYEQKLQAVANWICEEDKNEVTEWISVPANREKLLQELQNYVKGDVSVEDTYFLQGIKLQGCEWQKQKHPYLMVRMLDSQMPVPERCYINDIT